MPPAGFETAIPTSERPQTHALERSAAGIGKVGEYHEEIRKKICPETFFYPSGYTTSPHLVCKGGGGGRSILSLGFLG
jgi:hypothetical protein